jgi:hypothetical protein
MWKQLPLPGVVIVGVVAILTMALTFAVILWLREHEDRLAHGVDASRGAPTMAGAASRSSRSQRRRSTVARSPWIEVPIRRWSGVRPGV